MFEHDGLTVSWLGYATLRVEGPDSVVYCDPGRYGVLDSYAGGDADLVCVTHAHHYDSDAIRQVAGEDCTLVVFDGMDVRGIDRDVERPADLPVKVRTVDAHADFAVDDIVVRTVPAYNHPDGPRADEQGRVPHPEGRGCGYHLTVPSRWDRDVSVFWPGDTDVLEGHDQLDVSLLCPPIGGSFTMDRHEAAELADATAPDLVCPIHYDTFEALETDAAAFAADVAGRGVPVVLEDPEDERPE